MTTITIPRALLEQAYRAGWVSAAIWAMRDDLIADIDSRAYLDDRDISLAELAKQTQHDAHDVAALKAERDEAMKDAERYRYLRGQQHWSEALEKAIDAATAKAEGRKE